MIVNKITIRDHLGQDKEINKSKFLVRICAVAYDETWVYVCEVIESLVVSAPDFNQQKIWDNDDVIILCTEDSITEYCG